MTIFVPLRCSFRVLPTEFDLRSIPLHDYIGSVCVVFLSMYMPCHACAPARLCCPRKSTRSLKPLHYSKSWEKTCLFLDAFRTRVHTARAAPSVDAVEYTRCHDHCWIFNACFLMFDCRCLTCRITEGSNNYDCFSLFSSLHMCAVPSLLNMYRFASSSVVQSTIASWCAVWCSKKAQRRALEARLGSRTLRYDIKACQQHD